MKTKLRSRCTISALGELCRDGLLHVCRVWALGVEVAHAWQEKLDFEKKRKNYRSEETKNLKMKRDGTIGTYGMMEAASKRTTYIQAQSRGKNEIFNFTVWS